MTKGEEKIFKILKQNKISFEQEKSFYDLHKGLFRFDFYLPKEKVIIEYDGEQHFHFIKYFHKNREDFLRGQENDRRKNAYCLAKQIPLYRVPYWELDNVNILNDIFQDKYLVNTKWWNDFLKPPHK